MIRSLGSCVLKQSPRPAKRVNLNYSADEVKRGHLLGEEDDGKVPARRKDEKKAGVRRHDFFGDDALIFRGGTYILPHPADRRRR
jgi:hypothetical protein